MSRALVTVVMVLVAGASHAAAPTPPSPTAPAAAERLSRAQVCAAALDFECAEAELVAARTGVDALTAAQRHTLWRVSAEVALSTDRRGDAVAHLGELLALEPTFAPAPGAWPAPWLDALATARRLAPDRLPPDLEVAVPEQLEVGQSVAITVRASDPSGVARVRLSVGNDIETRTLTMATTDGTTWTVDVPRELVVAPALAIWAEAWDQRDNGPAAWGSAAMPHRIPVVAPAIIETPAIYETWWFWTGVGVVVAGGVLAAVLLTDGGGGDNRPAAPQSGDVSVVLLPP